MTTLSKIAKECGISYKTIYPVARELFTFNFENTRTVMLDEFEEHKLKQTLYLRGYFEYLTFESKINN